MNNITKSTKKRLASKKGMTLVEVLVAMTLLVLIVMVFTPLFMTYFRNTRIAGEKTKTTYERASIMERLIANPGGSNDTGYETSVGAVPITLKAGTQTPVSFSNEGSNPLGAVHGTMVSESLERDDSYVSFFTPSTGSTMICFPAELTDDFITKDITVVPKGFKFADAALNNKSAVTGYHFEVYNTLDTGSKNKVSTNYYDIRTELDGDGGKVAIFTFKGANDVICFERSPLWIQYCGNGGMLYQVKVEIGAPEIIMVGEKASDDNYYYYATAGVDVKTGHMDIVAKQMTKDKDGNDVSLVSAMNDVEWVAKGRGDDGEVHTDNNVHVNSYGYYIMGGDAGQVRRFRRNETTGNYYWGGDVLGNYDRYLYITGSNTKDGSSYENVTQTKTKQAQFKSVFRSNIGNYAYNSIENANQLTADELITIGFEYRMITANYYTANVTYDSAHPYFTAIGRVLSIKNGDFSARYAGCGTELFDKKDTLFAGFVAFRQTANGALRTLMPANNTYSKLNVDGYIEATNYEYQKSKGAKINDKSLITITSVGAVQINTSNSNYYESTHYSIFNKQLYPTRSYTLYCGYIPAVIDTWGWKTKNIGSLKYNNYSMWLHTGTLGIATDGSYWYPVGKFGDTKTSTNNGEDLVGNLSQSIFGKNTSWKTLLNYGTDAGMYPFNNQSTTITSELVQATEDKIGKVKFEVKYDWKALGSGTSTDTVTTINGTYNSEREQFCKNAYPTKIYEFYVTDAEGNRYTTVINDSKLNSGTKYSVKIGSDKWATVEYNVESAFGYDKYRLVFPEEIRETVYVTKTENITGYIRYFGPTSDGSGFSTKPSDVTNATLTKRSFLGTALPAEGTNYYVSAGHEVDITMGYLSQPYAIDINNPTVPRMSGLSGLTGGSDFYFKKPGDGIGSSILSGGAFNHSFVSGGLRDNVTMLDVKSFHDDLTGNNISIAAGYTLSYVANDNNYLTRLGQVLNNGVVYIRATGDGTENDDTGDLASGKGWSLKKETNVFHQFFGIDQYRGVSIGGGAGTDAINGWTTTYHKGYLNMSTDSDKEPQASYSPSITEGNNNYGVNYHPLMDTECTTVNWGTTPDLKPQAMWGTSNGTLMSWYYNYESVQDSKIYSVCKEFENYIWCDRLGLKPTTDTLKKVYYDYTTVGRSTLLSIGDSLYRDYGFVSVLKNVNDVCFCDDVWVAVGDQSGKKPSDYSANMSWNRSGATGNAGSYVNVKFLDESIKDSNGLPLARWIHVKISDATNVNFKSVVNCQGVWYIMGYVDVNTNGVQDTGDYCVIYYSKQPQDGFLRCDTRKALDGDNMYVNTNGQIKIKLSDKTYAMCLKDDGTWKTLELTGINKMACQS